jgi:NAD-dependent DNA ligase
VVGYTDTPRKIINKNMDKLSEIELKGKLSYFNESYRKGEPEISDIEYDNLVEELRMVNPNSDWFNKIEPGAISGRSVKLPIPMRSLYKVKTLDEIMTWLNKYGVKEDNYVLIMPKYDGCSLLVDEVNQTAFSRGGDDNVGEDCTMHYKKCKSKKCNNKNLQYTFGEFIISKSDWNSHFKNRRSEKTGKVYTSARNVASGILGSNDEHPLGEHVSFIRYGAVCTSYNTNSFSFFMEHLNSEFDQDQLQKKIKVEELTDDLLMDLYIKWSDNFQIDGLVVYIDDMSLWDKIGRHESTGNPLYAMAYKSPNFSEVYESEVVSVNWQISKAGYMKPTVRIKPVYISGCKIDNPTGYNAAFISDNNIGPGAIVKLIRSGEVIPKIVGVKRPAEVYVMNNIFDEMSVCPHCGNDLKWNKSFVEIQCLNPLCDGIQLERIKHFFFTVGVKGVGDEAFNKLFEAGFKTVGSILHFNNNGSGILAILGTALGNTLIEHARNIKCGIPVEIAMSASNCFVGIGEKKASALYSEYGHLISDNWELSSDFDDSSITGINFKIGMPLFKKFIEENAIKILVPEDQDTIKSPLNGMKVCFTGFRDRSLEAELKKYGCNVLNTLSRFTDILVTKEKYDQKTGKAKKAYEMGIKTMNVEEFKNHIFNLTGWKPD